jgi:hypothetical protein
MEIIVQPPSDNPDYANKVIIYKDPNYAGDSQELGTGRFNINDLEIGTDTLSSIKVPDGKIVTLYDQEDFKGEKRRVVEDNPNLGDFNDKTTSIIVQLAVEIFDGPNYTGNRQTFPIGIYNTGEFNLSGPMASIKIAPGLMVAMYDEPNQKGNRTVFIKDQPSIEAKFSNVEIESIEINLLKITVPDGLDLSDILPQT